MNDGLWRFACGDVFFTFSSLPVQSLKCNCWKSRAAWYNQWSPWYNQWSPCFAALARRETDLARIKKICSPEGVESMFEGGSLPMYTIHWMYILLLPAASFKLSLARYNKPSQDYLCIKTFGPTTALGRGGLLKKSPCKFSSCRLHHTNRAVAGLLKGESNGGLDGKMDFGGLFNGNVFNGKKSWSSLTSFLPTTETNTEVSSIEAITAQVAWRAMVPVSKVTVCWPNWKVLVTILA